MTKLSFKSLSDDEFEELCLDLLRAEGFVNIKKMSGPGGGDFGRDIHGEEIVTLRTGQTRMEEILIQCKKYNPKSVNNTQMGAILNNARTLNYTRVIVCTSSDFTSDARTTAHNASKARMPLEVTLWNGNEIEKILSNYPKISERYFKTKIPKERSKRVAFSTLPIPRLPIPRIEIELQNKKGEWHKCNMLLDTGSQISIIPKSVYDSLGLNAIHSREIRVTTYGGIKRLDVALINARFASKSFPLNAAIMENEDFPPVIGREFLNHFMITIRDGKIHFHGPVRK